jgi:hypothetical protein
MKRTWGLCSAAITIFLLVLAAGPVWAYPSLDVAGGKDSLKFTVSGSTIRVDILSKQVTGTSNGLSDPLVGKYQQIYVPAHTSYDFTLGSGSGGVYSLSGGPATYRVTDKSSTGSTMYLQGALTALTIDFNLGIINWSPVSGLTTSNTGSLGSPTLNEFSNYSTGLMTFSFVTSDSLKSWISNPKNSYTTSYSSSLTVTPEPATWILILAGAGLLGFSLYRKRLPAEWRVGAGESAA